MKKKKWKKRIIAWSLVTSMLAMMLPFTSGIKTEAAETLKEEEKLFYGYNVTSGKNLMEPDALQTAFPIIDPNSDYLSHVKKIEGTMQTSQDYSGTSLSEVSEAFAQNISAEAFGRIYVVDAGVSTAFDTTRTVDNVYSEKYELYTTSISRYYYIVQLSLEEIRQYLSAQFKADLGTVANKQDAKKIFDRYGTHLLTGYNFGGRMNITNYMTTSDTSVDLKKGVALKEKVSAVLSKVQVGESASIVEEYSSLENNKTSTSTYKFESFGGEATSSLTLDGLFTYNASYVDGNNAGFMYTRWINSINENKNLAIIGIPSSACSIPLWELLDSSEENSDTRQLLKDTYIEICGDKYDEYLEKYPDRIRTYEETNEETAIMPTFNGAYLRTAKGLFYYVDQNDFTSTGSHCGIHSNETIYLDLKYIKNSTDVTFECKNCEEVNAQSGKFKVTGTSGYMSISIKCGDKKQELMNVPILPAVFEGGMGNEEYPYIVTTVEHFSSIPKYNSSHYLLYNDIDFEGSTISNLGNFKGVFDGNYCTISNFVIATEKEWGLFSKNEGTIKNLAIKNAGSTTSLAGFQVGVTDYVKEYENEYYTKNSISAINAGIICASNYGSIENCYVTESYIRNITKEQTNWFVNSEITIRTGVITGMNAGSISDCMVKDCGILSANINEQGNTFNINVFSGGLAGQIQTGGSISSCVVDMGADAVVMSQIANRYSKDNADVRVQAYSGGIAGYSNTSFSMNNSFVYVRNTSATYRAIDAVCTFKKSSGWFPKWLEPKKYHALKAAVIVCGENGDIITKDNNVYSLDPAIPGTCIRPSSKNGINSENSKDCYEEINTVSENKVDSQAKYNQLGLTETSFLYDSTSSSMAHIKHILSTSRQSYIKLQVDKAGAAGEEIWYDGSTFSPKGIELLKEVNRESNPAKVFRIKVLTSKGIDVTNSLLFADSAEKYRVVMSMYDGEIVEKQGITLEISENKIKSVSVVDDEELYHIFYDEKEEYINSWNASKIKLQAVMTNGEIIPIENVLDTEVSVKTKAESIIRGDNIIEIKYVHDNRAYEISYILRVEERKISSISIAQTPKETSYTEGDTVKLDGLEVDVNYETGNSTRLKDADLSKLEVIGTTVAEGKNTVTVLYGGYNYQASFEVEGKKKEGVAAPVKEETTQSQSGEQEKKQEVSKIDWRVWICVGAIAVGVIALVVVLKVSKKKRNQTVSED